MINEIIFCSLFYWLLAFLVVYPPDEAVSAGLTVETLLGNWLGSEILYFVGYHIRRTATNVIVHSLLIPGYLMMLYWVHPWIVQSMMSVHPLCFEAVALLSILPCICACVMVWLWSWNHWEKHPFSKDLAFYVNSGYVDSHHTSWKSLASEINIEFRRVDKFSSRLNNVSRIVATDSWLLKITSYSMKAIPLRDALLFLESSFDTTVITSDSSRTPSQFLQVRVSSVRREVDKPFYFRIDSVSLKELKRKLINPIVNSKRITIHETLADRFLLSFEETIRRNPQVPYEGSLDSCIGCMNSPSNIKLERRCKDGNPESPCSVCSCRPMWCISCLSRWFASRQDENQPQTWLSSTAPCPTCRCKFCLLDVCIVDGSAAS